MKKILYSASIAMFSLFAIVLLFTTPENNLTLYNVSAFLIWFVFFCDYIIRLFVAEKKLEFIMNNKIDLVAIIPFNIFFQAFNILRLLRLFSITKRIYLNLTSFVKTNYFIYILYISLTTIFISALFMYFFEGYTFFDAIWWSFVTITTVGYGDIVPTTLGGKIVAVTLMLSGIGMIGYLSSTITTFFINKAKSKPSFKNAQIELIKEHIDNVENLSSEDIEEICNTLKTLSKKIESD